MLLGVNQNAEDKIIRLLGKRGKMSAEKLQALLQKRNTDITIQGIYRVLRKLQKNGIVIKEKQWYAIRLPWILDLASLVEDMQNTYLQYAYIKQLIPTNEKEKRSWFFTNLSQMSNFWSQILLVLSQVVPNSVVLDYAPHVWYILTHEKQEKQFIKTFSAKVRKIYSVVGGKTYLDKHDAHGKFAEADSPNEILYFANENEYIVEERTKYITIMQDYVLTIQVRDDIAKAIDTFYTKTTNHEQMDLSNLFAIVTKSTKVKLTLEKNVKKSKTYCKKFEKLFGPLE